MITLTFDQWTTNVGHTCRICYGRENVPEKTEKNYAKQCNGHRTSLGWKNYQNLNMSFKLFARDFDMAKNNQ